MNSYFLEAPSFDRQRERFLSAARMADASMTEWLHPLKGPLEETLVTDVAVLGDPCAPSRLVVLSGTHASKAFMVPTARSRYSILFEHTASPKA